MAFLLLIGGVVFNIGNIAGTVRDASGAATRLCAVRVMREDYGLDLTSQTSKSLEVFTGETFDWVISLCDRVREVCPEFPGGPQAVHWCLPNPATGEADDITYPLFRQTAAELSTRIDFLLARLAEPKAA